MDDKHFDELLDSVRDMGQHMRGTVTDLDNLPEPEVLAEEIVEHLRSALASFESVNAA